MLVLSNVPEMLSRAFIFLFSFQIKQEKNPMEIIHDLFENKYASSKTVVKIYFVFKIFLFKYS